MLVARFNCNLPALLFRCSLCEKILESSKYDKGICQKLYEVQKVCGPGISIAVLTKRRSDDGAASGLAKYTG
jgi:hypothetical protein